MLHRRKRSWFFAIFEQDRHQKEQNRGGIKDNRRIGRESDASPVFQKPPINNRSSPQKEVSLLE